MKRIHLFAIFSFVTLGIGFALLALILFWTLYPYKIITFDGQVNEVLTQQVRQGEIGSYSVTYCKYSEPPVVKERYFVDELVYQAETRQSILPSGCNKVLVNFQVPPQLPTGIYHIRTVAHYKVNPIRTITIERITSNFEVIQ